MGSTYYGNNCCPIFLDSLDSLDFLDSSKQTMLYFHFLFRFQRYTPNRPNTASFKPANSKYLQKTELASQHAAECSAGGAVSMLLRWRAHPSCHQEVLCYTEKRHCSKRGPFFLPVTGTRALERSQCILFSSVGPHSPISPCLQPARALMLIGFLTKFNSRDRLMFNSPRKVWNRAELPVPATGSISSFLILLSSKI